MQNMSNLASVYRTIENGFAMKDFASTMSAICGINDANREPAPATPKGKAAFWLLAAAMAISLVAEAVGPATSPDNTGEGHANS